ncbi:retrovirus-related Pol polyprotein from transposon opus [Trichonephila clavipes]|nr:retrovirus-related Pol polyprotein from transposon opus [Trichonephila clavipes]
MICSDQGTNFTSKLSEMFLSVMGVSPRFCTPGHPESMGAVERWNRTLKDMLIYGRLPSGPISLLKEVWVGERNIPTSLSRSVEKYLEDLIEKLRKAHEIAAETAEATQNNYASYYNLRSGKAIQDHISSDCQELDDVQRLELLNTLGKFSSLFSSLPGLAKVKGHNLKLKPDFTPKKMHPYRIPIALQQEVDCQINELLHLKLIEPSESEWAHPIVCVSKRTEVSDYVLTTDI